METVTVYDCTAVNLPKIDIPPGVLMAGYVTGSLGVPWTDAQLRAHPDALRIDQAPVNTPANETADMLDVELRAGTVADVPGWSRGAWDSWHAGLRPGQRTPTIYVEESELTPVANALDAAGITSGVNLFLTKPMTVAEAMRILETAGGPFPIVGVQYAFEALYDVSLVSKAWLDNVSKAPVEPQPESGVQAGWRFCRKCKGLFYGPEQSTSRCPVGAQHDGSDSYVYNLGFTR